MVWIALHTVSSTYDLYVYMQGAPRAGGVELVYLNLYPGIPGLLLVHVLKGLGSQASFPCL